MHFVDPWLKMVNNLIFIRYTTYFNALLNIYLGRPNGMEENDQNDESNTNRLVAKLLKYNDFLCNLELFDYL